MSAYLSICLPVYVTIHPFINFGVHLHVFVCVCGRACLCACMCVRLCVYVCVCGREPDIPSLAPLLYQLQVEGVQEKRDTLSLPIPDRIRIGNQKRERGNFHFQREEYHMAARAYLMALDVLTTRARGER